MEESRLFPVGALHAEDLDHADEDVEEVQLEADALVDDIAADETPLGEASVVQDLLDVVEGEAAEDGETAVQPDLLGPHQGAGRSGGEDQRGETGERDDGHTGEERATQVQVLLLLSGGADESDRAHHADSVETGTSEQGGVHEHQGREQRSLGEVERRPKTVFDHIANFQRRQSNSLMLG